MIDKLSDMNQLLIKLKIIERFTIPSYTSKEDFVSRLREITDIGIDKKRLTTLEESRRKDNVFDGNVDLSGFKVRKWRWTGNRYFDEIYAVGRYVDENGKLNIEVEIDGFTWSAQIQFAFLCFTTIFTICVCVSIGGFFGVPLALFIIIIFAGVPFLILRYSVSNLKNKITAEFKELTK